MEVEVEVEKRTARDLFLLSPTGEDGQGQATTQLLRLDLRVAPFLLGTIGSWCPASSAGCARATPRGPTSGMTAGGWLHGGAAGGLLDGPF